MSSSPSPVAGEASADAGRASLRRRAEALAGSGRRRVLGIVGAPGSGKSTLARQVVEWLGPSAQNVPMDGFHLANDELERRGSAGRKGAPETFDVDGYASLLERLTAAPYRPVYAPEFRREIEEPVAGAIRVAPEVALVVTEGNYLLLDGEWSRVRTLLDEVWFVEQDEERRLEQLVARHVRFGRTERVARAWAAEVDQANADLVRSTRGLADLVVHLDGDGPRLGVEAGGVH